MDQDLTAFERTLRGRAGADPLSLAIVLGSGLGGLVEQLRDAVVFPYAEFPFFPAQRLEGHPGQLLVGWLDGVRVLVFQGRFHFYQGLSARQVAVPVQLAKALGVPRILLTNAVGGVNPSYQAGDFMYVADHLNFLGDNPLRGEVANPFLDLCQLYRQEFYPPLAVLARDLGVSLHQGVLAAMPGPSYETPAEIRALARLGADAVTMSTIPEAILAHYYGLEVVALSFIANLAAGRSSASLTHQDVLAAGATGAKALAQLVRHLCTLWVSSNY